MVYKKDATLSVDFTNLGDSVGLNMMSLDKNNMSRFLQILKDGADSGSSDHGLDIEATLSPRTILGVAMGRCNCGKQLAFTNYVARRCAACYMIVSDPACCPDEDCIFAICLMCATFASELHEK